LTALDDPHTHTHTHTHTHIVTNGVKCNLAVYAAHSNRISTFYNSAMEHGI